MGHVEPQAPTQRSSQRARLTKRRRRRSPSPKTGPGRPGFKIFKLKALDHDSLTGFPEDVPTRNALPGSWIVDDCINYVIVEAAWHDQCQCSWLFGLQEVSSIRLHCADGRMECEFCGRKFNPASYERHQPICQKVGSE